MSDPEPQETRTIPVSYKLDLILEHQEYILEELERLRILKEYELNVRVEDVPGGDPRVVPVDEE